jgi:hypothetical protein
MRPQKHSAAILSWFAQAIKRVGLHYIGFSADAHCSAITFALERAEKSRNRRDRDELGLTRRRFPRAEKFPSGRDFSARLLYGIVSAPPTRGLGQNANSGLPLK